MLQQGLLITAIGMGLVFAVIIFLWGLMALMMRLTSQEKGVEVDTAENLKTDLSLDSAANNDEGQRQAAVAAAVQIAITAAKVSKTRETMSDQNIESNPWQLFHRLRQLGISKRRG